MWSGKASRILHVGGIVSDLRGDQGQEGKGKGETEMKSNSGSRATGRHIWALGIMKKRICLALLKVKISPSPVSQSPAIEVHSEKWIDFWCSFQLEPPLVLNAWKAFSAKQDSFQHTLRGQKSVIISKYCSAANTGIVPCKSRVQRLWVPLVYHQRPRIRHSWGFWWGSFLDSLVPKDTGPVEWCSHYMRNSCRRRVPQCVMPKACFLLASGVQVPDSSRSRRKRFIVYLLKKCVKGTETMYQV